MGEGAGVRTVGVFIKTVSIIFAALIAIGSLLTGLTTMGIAAIFAMLLLFLCQSAEVFLLYRGKQ